MANAQPITWGSSEVNGQLVAQPPSSAFFPLDMGAQYRGPGYYPRQGSYQVPPVVPSPNLGPQPVGSAGTAQQVDNSNPWHPTQGTIIFGFLALVVGLFGLHYIHYGA